MLPVVYLFTAFGGGVGDGGHRVLQEVLVTCLFMMTQHHSEQQVLIDSSRTFRTPLTRTFRSRESTRSHHPDKQDQNGPVLGVVDLGLVPDTGPCFCSEPRVTGSASARSQATEENRVRTSRKTKRKLKLYPENNGMMLLEVLRLRKERV